MSLAAETTFSNNYVNMGNRHSWLTLAVLCLIFVRIYHMSSKTLNSVINEPRLQRSAPGKLTCSVYISSLNSLMEIGRCKLALVTAI